MTVVFVFRDGKTRSVGNLKGTFEDFSTKNCRGRWAIFNDITINMDDVSYFYEDKKKQIS